MITEEKTDNDVLEKTMSRIKQVMSAIELAQLLHLVVCILIQNFQSFHLMVLKIKRDTPICKWKLPFFFLLRSQLGKGNIIES